MHPQSRITAAARHALSLLAPPACPACGRPSGRRARAWLCPDCRPRLRRVPVCLTCGRRVADTPSLRLHPPRDCRACRPLHPAYDLALSVGAYRGPWRKAVLAFKSNPRGEASVQLAGLLRRLLLASPEGRGCRVVVPVPPRNRLHGHPASALARQTALRLGLPFRSALKFVRPTRPQRGLSRHERLRNLKRALAANPARIQGLSLLVVDDVYTTGATASECARALKTAGAAAVVVATLARG